MKKLLAASSALIQSYVLFPVFAHAQTISPGLSGADTNLDQVNTGATARGGALQADLPALIGRFINVVLGIMGIVLVIYIIWAGIDYISSRGDATKVKDSIAKIRNAVIGIIMILAAYAIANFVISSLISATT